MPETWVIHRWQIAVRAYEFLNRWRGPTISDADFEDLVREEITLTIRQMKANGWRVVG